MKLEVGMYVRTFDGYIDKIVDIRYHDNYNTEPSIILLEKTKGYIEQKEHNIERDSNGNITKIKEDKKTYWFIAKSIKKASHNIIELIQKKRHHIR